MKKIILFLMLIFLFIPKVNASTASANSYVLMDEATGRVLMSKNKDEPMLIASITKIMTAVLAIESGKLDKIVTVDESILKSYGSAIYIEVGEKMKLEDLLYGLMLRSGNDAAVMIASYVAKSPEEFVKKMNEKAKEIGMKNTTFNNPSGLDEEVGNYSTSYDMALLTRYADKYPEYRKIVSTKKHTVKTNYKTYIWHNKNKLLSKEYITGGKTGYTKKAGRTLVTSSANNNMSFIVVTLRDSDDWNTHTYLHDYAYSTYLPYKVLNKDNFTINVQNQYKDNTYIKSDLIIPLTEKESKQIDSKINLLKLAKYKNGDKVGTIDIYLKDKSIYTENIYVHKNKSSKKSFWTKLKEKH